MQKTYLAILEKVGRKNIREAAQSRGLDEIRSGIYANVSEFISPHKGNGFTAILHSDNAWGQNTYEHCGVVFGETEPALFMYFFSFALQQQEKRMLKAVYETLSQKGDKVMDGQKTGMGMSAYAIDMENFVADPWIRRCSLGGFMHDCGLYSLIHQRASLSEEETDEIKENIQDYALCVLDVYE